MIKISLFNGWTEANLSPHNWSNRSRFKNYLAITLMSNSGKILKELLECSKENDIYFNVNKVEVGNILLASCWDSYKKRQYKNYWLVVDKNNDHIVLLDYSTYRTAFKDWESTNYRKYL